MPQAAKSERSIVAGGLFRSRSKMRIEIRKGIRSTSRG
jgi:hypothetical protein